MILVLGGTKEANELIKILNAQGYEVLVTTVSSYGGELAKESGAQEILVGKLDAQALANLIESRKIKVVLDATHPYASQVTFMAKETCERLGVTFLRHTRPMPSEIIKEDNFHWVNSYQEAANLAFKLGDVVLSTIGSNNVACFQTAKGENQRLVVRILPDIASIKQCREAGCLPKDIIAMQGPFSKEMNKIILKEYGIQVMVTKDTGATGGLDEKIAAARELQIPVVIIRRPLEPIKIYSHEEILEILKEVTKKCH